MLIITRMHFIIYWRFYDIYVQRLQLFRDELCITTRKHALTFVNENGEFAENTFHFDHFLGEREYLIGQDVYSAADVMMFSSNELIYFHVVEPSKIGYVFKVRPARDFGDSFHTLYNRVHLVPVQPALACKEIENSQLISGSFALVERGDCPFVTKAKHAENAGAIGVLIADNDFSNDAITVNMIGDDSVTQVSIPAGLMLAEDSKHIKEALKTEGRNSAVIKIPVNVTNSPELFIKQPPWSYW